MTNRKALARIAISILSLFVLFTITFDFQNNQRREVELEANINTILSKIALEEIGSIGDIPQIEGVRAAVLFKSGFIKTRSNYESSIKSDDIYNVFKNKNAKPEGLIWFKDEQKNIAIGYEKTTTSAYIFNLTLILTLCFAVFLFRRKLTKSESLNLKHMTEKEVLTNQLADTKEELQQTLDDLNKENFRRLNKHIREKLESSKGCDISSAMLVEEIETNTIANKQIKNAIEEFKNLHVGAAYERFERIMGTPILRGDEFENIHIDLQTEHNEALGTIVTLKSEISELKQSKLLSSQQSTDLTVENEALLQSINEIFETLESINLTFEQSNKANNVANTLSDKCKAKTTSAISVSTKATDSMNQIKEFSQKISSIVLLIDEISYKTKLLALNANVEAANAGVHGKGFSVVASEVKQLAQSSAKRSQEIKKLIEESLVCIEQGVNHVDATSNSLNEISAIISEVQESVKEISATTSEQNNNTKLLFNNIKQNKVAEKKATKKTKNQTVSGPDRVPRLNSKTNAPVRQNESAEKDNTTATPAHHKNKGDYSNVDDTQHWDTF